MMWTAALSNSIKVWAMLCRATQDRWVMVDSSDKTWSTGEGNGTKIHHHFGTEAPRRLGEETQRGSRSGGQCSRLGMGAVVPTRRWVEQALALAAVFSAALLSAPAACLLPCLVSRVSSPGCSAQCLLWARPVGPGDPCGGRESGGEGALRCGHSRGQG